MRHANCRWVSIPVILVSLSLPCFAQTAVAPLELIPAKPIERELKGSETHAYSISLTTGQFLHVIVDQRGVDVVVVLFDPDGKQIAEVDSPNGTRGPEPVSLVAKAAGDYRLEVRSVEKKAAAGRYELKVEALRVATAKEKVESEAKDLARVLASAKTDEERATILAQKKEFVTVELVRALYEHGRDFRNQRKFPQALAISRLALGLAERIGDKTGVGDFLYNIGCVFHFQGDSAQALEYLEKSFALREQLGEKMKAGDSLNVIGSVYSNQQNNPTKALEYYRKSLALYQETGDRQGEIGTLNNIGLVFRNQGEFAQALEAYQKMLSLAEALGDKGGTANAQNNIGQILRDQGKYTQAIEAFQRGSAMFEVLGNKLALGNTMLDIGHTYELQGNFVTALEYRQKALALGEALGNKALMAQTFLNLGHLYWRQGKFGPAMEYFESELKLRVALGDKQAIAVAHNKLGQLSRDQGNYPRALEAAQRSLKLSESLGNNALLSEIMMTFGLVYQAQGNVAQSLDAYQKSLTFAEEAGVKPLIANALEKVGAVYHSQGKIEEALEHIQKALKLNEELGNKRQIVFSANAIAAIHRSQGNYAQALEYYRKSLKLSEEIGNKIQIATALNMIGVIHSDQGDYTQALEHIQRGLKVREEIAHLSGVQASLNNIGEVYRLRGDPVQAMEYYQRTLALAEKIGSKGGKRIALTNIGEAYRLQDKYAQAIEHLRKSLALGEEMGERLTLPETLISMAGVHLAQADYTQSLEFSERAADIARQTGHREYLRSALTTSARAYRALNLPDKARQSFEEAIAISESLRSSVAGQESRASYFVTVQQSYELYIDLLMQLHRQHPSEGNDIAALRLSERSRARSLLEALNEARADIRQGVDPALLQRERILKQRLNAAGERQTRLLTEKHTNEQVTAVQKEIAALTTEFQDVQAQIRQRSPRYAALTQPVPLSLQEIQTSVLDADTLLLEYALGEERSYLWAVTPTSINSFELPKRSEIETAVRRAVRLLSDGRQWSTSNKVELEYAEVAGRLSRMLLEPVAAQLKGKRLLIVADGALQYLPFGALPSPKFNVQGPTSRNPRQNTASGQPLIVEHEIVSLPSASTLAILRRETANRARPPKSIAVMADPVFERDDERVSLAPTGTQTASKAGAASASKDTNSQTTNARYLLERAFGLGLEPATAEDGTSREILRIPRLPFTRREADAILAIAPAGAGMKALDFRASRETAMNPELAQYRIIHFATHGLLNSEHPELSGIVLSLLNEKGEPVDGFLRLHEIYNLNLPADLVVLSACQTGLGKEIRGEGLVGLTRGFMYAGSPRVVASLWKVADAATAELMTRFYRGMLREKMRPAAALRAAQMEMLKQKRWRAPFYWAAFELQGEWK